MAWTKDSLIAVVQRNAAVNVTFVKMQHLAAFLLHDQHRHWLSAAKCLGPCLAEETCSCQDLHILADVDSLSQRQH